MICWNKNSLSFICVAFKSPPKMKLEGNDEHPVYVFQHLFKANTNISTIYGNSNVPSFVDFLYIKDLYEHIKRK